MAEPLKELFNPTIVSAMGQHLQRCYPDFKRKRFEQQALTGLAELELKARATHIQSALDAQLPEDFRQACEIMLASLSTKTNEDWLPEDIHSLGISGWAVMPMADIVAQRGLADFDYAMSVLAEMTKRFTAEFAVRPFFVADEDRALGIAKQWALDENYHVRRLASEGSRPRLPWGIRLQSFNENPEPLIPLLALLKDDPSDYVRRSVANSLNDIAKTHPALVAQVAEQWSVDASPNREQLIKHACRTLIKSGHKPTLAALGYSSPNVGVQPIKLTRKHIRLGEHLPVSVSIQSSSDKTQKLIIDYIIYFRKANGSLSAKTFKWKTIELKPKEKLTLEKAHPFKPITTRVYHAGQHGIALQINGEAFDIAEFTLEL